MSMIGHFRMATDSEIEWLLENPWEIEPLLDWDSDEPREGACKMDVDKAWHGIHFLLCGDADATDSPLSFILAGEPVGDVDVGYGPARAYTSAEVAEIAQAIGPITPDDLCGRFDTQALIDNEIYPDPWEEPAADALWLVDYFGKLKSFVLEADKRGSGLLVYLD